MKSSIDGIILCGGQGKRSGASKNKVLCYFGIKTALEYCLDVLSPICDRLVVVANRHDREEISAIARLYGAEVTDGGETRYDSVKNGLKLLSGDIVVIHDAARPFVTEQVVRRCIDSAIKFGSGIAATKEVDTVKRVVGDEIVGELSRDELYRMQTPQAFKLSEIKAAYLSTSGGFTDDSAVYSAYGLTPRIVLSDEFNKKITLPEDMISPFPCNKIGTGIDFHTLVSGRPLILGGVNIPYEKGLLGHSDADVLTHAVMDALLSAIGQPDIGVLFPSTDEFKDADSFVLLESVMKKVRESGGHIASVSAVVMAQSPKLSPFIPAIRKKLAGALGVDERNVNVSATTTEGLGIIGKGEGIAASAVCLMQTK